MPASTATELSETIKAVNLCREKGVKLMTALQRRFDPNFARVKKSIVDGECPPHVGLPSRLARVNNGRCVVGALLPRGAVSPLSTGSGSALGMVLSAANPCRNRTGKILERELVAVPHAWAMHSVVVRVGLGRCGPVGHTAGARIRTLLVDRESRCAACRA